MFEISPQILNNLQAWGLWWPFQNLNSSFLEVFHGWFRGMLWIIILLEYPTSLQLQCLDWPLNISLYNLLIWYLVESILPSTRTIFPVPHTTPTHNGSTSMLNSWQGVLLNKGFTLFYPNIPSSLVAKFWFRQFKAHCPKRLHTSHCFILHAPNFVLRSFFLGTLPFRSLLFKVRCIVVL